MGGIDRAAWLPLVLTVAEDSKQQQRHRCKQEHRQDASPAPGGMLKLARVAASMVDFLSELIFHPLDNGRLASISRA